MLRATALLSCLSLAVMATVDCLLGARAEFLNAWSVIERLAGRSPTAGSSTVARRFGPGGELGAILAVNLAIGAVLAGVFRGSTRLVRLQWGDERGRGVARRGSV